MTEGDRAFCKRRIREEVSKARSAENPQLKELHLRWAILYQERLYGTSKSVTRILERRLRDAGLDVAQLPEVDEPIVSADDRNCAVGWAG